MTNIIFSTLHEVNSFIFDFLVGNADEAQLAEIVAYMKEYVAQAEKMNLDNKVDSLEFFI